jgi:hypothetical protein
MQLEEGRMHTNRWTSCTYGALLFAILALSCSTAREVTGGGAPRPGLPNSPDGVLAGAWSGLHAALSAVADGATLEFDCAHGRIAAPVQLDAQGRFDAPGVYVPERGGPAAPIEQNGQAARYAGQVTGAHLTLTVTIAETAESRGPFVLTHDAAPKLVQCF